MNREQLKKIDRFLTFGDIKPKVDETDCYYITDKAMQKVIDGFSKELLELHRIITMNQLIEVRKRAGEVEPVVIKPTQFVEMPYDCDNCGGQTKIKIQVNKYGEYDIDPPYFCNECDKLID